MKISVIVPFYHGNQYLTRLIKSIEAAELVTHGLSEYEIIIVNDSPEEKVKIPGTYINIKLISNGKNQGIQKSRINGIQASTGNWILMLDQDDELIADGFINQIELSKEADVVVGNGVYRLSDVNQIIYSSIKEMDYLIKEENFIKIRNLIPSPGECLIKKECLPDEWMTNLLETNGADDWFLWLLLFKSKAKFACNVEMVYQHNDSEGNNLSANLEKMKQSSLEMAGKLFELKKIDEKEYQSLLHGIEFKYKQDTKQLTLKDVLKLFDSLYANIIYRSKRNYY